MYEVTTHQVLFITREAKLLVQYTRTTYNVDNLLTTANTTNCEYVFSQARRESFSVCNTPKGSVKKTNKIS